MSGTQSLPSPVTLDLGLFKLGQHRHLQSRELMLVQKPLRVIRIATKANEHSEVIQLFERRIQLPTDCFRVPRSMFFDGGLQLLEPALDIVDLFGQILGRSSEHDLLFFVGSMVCVPRFDEVIDRVCQVLEGGSHRCVLENCGKSGSV
jgi:hypothetical protein